MGRSPAGDVVPRLAVGLAAYGRGDWPAAIAVRAGAGRNRAHRRQPRQRDLIENTLLAAYLRPAASTRPRRWSPIIPTGGPRFPSPA